MDTSNNFGGQARYLEILGNGLRSVYELLSLDRTLSVRVDDEGHSDLLVRLLRIDRDHQICDSLCGLDLDSLDILILLFIRELILLSLSSDGTLDGTRHRREVTLGSLNFSFPRSNLDVSLSFPQRENDLLCGRIGREVEVDDSSSRERGVSVHEGDKGEFREIGLFGFENESEGFREGGRGDDGRFSSSRFEEFGRVGGRGRESLAEGERVKSSSLGDNLIRFDLGSDLNGFGEEVREFVGEGREFGGSSNENDFLDLKRVEVRFLEGFFDL